MRHKVSPTPTALRPALRPGLNAGRNVYPLTAHRPLDTLPDGEQRLPLACGKYHSPMQVATGTVINDKIILEGVPLAEGARVTVVTRGADEDFALSPTQEDELLESLAEIDRGDCLTLDELLASLPR